MDDRTVISLLTGAVLLESSLRRAERAAMRSAHATMSRDLDRVLHVLVRRAQNVAVCITGAAGVAVILYSHRRSLPRHLRLSRPVSTVRWGVEETFSGHRVV